MISEKTPRPDLEKFFREYYGRVFSGDLEGREVIEIDVVVYQNVFTFIIDANPEGPDALGSLDVYFSEAFLIAEKLSRDRFDQIEKN